MPFDSFDVLRLVVTGRPGFWKGGVSLHHECGKLNNKPSIWDCFILGMVYDWVDYIFRSGALQALKALSYCSLLTMKLVINTSDI